MRFLLISILFTHILSAVHAGFCQTTYSCGYTCYQKVKTYTACGFLWASRCTRYRTTSSTCYRTCYDRECCQGYTGPSCSTPICSTTCSADGYCAAPNTCRCNNGYKLLADHRTCEDVNECAEGTSGCQQKCSNTKGSFQCMCNPGYELTSNGKTCTDINECSHGTSECQHTCTNNEGSFTCSCDTGFRLDINKRTCSDVDECSSGEALCDNYCVNTQGSYTCSCGSGYMLDEDGFSCHDVNECRANNGGCEHTCTNLPGSFRCSCLDGYEINENGKACSDTDECKLDISGCSQYCQNTEGSFVCTCKEGFELLPDGKTCSDIDDCVEVVCENGGTCKDGLNTFTCFCAEGFTSKFCETDVNECSVLNGGCHEVCVNTVGSYHCDCYEGAELNPDHSSCNNDEVDVVTCDNFQLKYLPHGCFPLPIAQNASEIATRLELTSTSQWYRKNSDVSTFFTFGIVFLKVDALSVPVSLRGIEVKLSEYNFQYSHGVSSSIEDSSVYDIGNILTNCQELKLVESNIFDYISCGAFFQTLLSSLSVAIPNWISFNKASDSLLSVQDLKTDIVLGKELDQIQWCKGAPVFDVHLYSVFRFDSTFNITVLGQEVHIPKPLRGNRFCLILDLDKSSVGTLFLMIPDGLQKLFEDVDVFRTLKEEKGVNVVPKGIGLSVTDGINLHKETTTLTLWNGDHVFQYPVFEKGNIWISASVGLSATNWIIDGKTDLYLDVPNLRHALTSIFHDEWNAYLSLKSPDTLKLKFEVFGRTHTLDLTNTISSTLDVYMSIGGENRVWCGGESNPPGLFFSVILTFNPFQDILWLENTLTSTHRAYLFVSADSDENLVSTDFGGFRSNMYSALQEMIILFDTTLDGLQVVFRNATLVTISSIKKELKEMKSIINSHTGIDFATIKHVAEHCWDLFVDVTKDIKYFFHETESIATETFQNFRNLVHDTENRLRKQLRLALNEITNVLIRSQESFTGFGFKYNASLNIRGKSFGEFDIELVYSSDSLLRCSRFESVMQHLEGERALRILIRASKNRDLNKFLKYEKGYGGGGAFSVSSSKFAIQLQVFANILGISLTADLFVTDNGLYLYMEGKVWNIFLCQLDISAEIGKDWQESSLKVVGRFSARANKKRQVQVDNRSFQDSYLDGLKKAVSFVADWANSRLSVVQDGLSKAQSLFRSAQTWLDTQKLKLRDANKIFDKAVEKLEDAKSALESAKGPFQEALGKLEAAQKRVDNLCQLKTCTSICVPGLKLTTCKKGWLTYPCLRFTSCMLSIPDPVCIAANIVCFAIRAAAYLALEAAKIFVRIPIMVFDAAKAAVSVAQFVVDKSRVALLVAEGMLELAKVGLEFTNEGLELAKQAVEGVKLAIGAAAHVLQFVIDYGIKTLVDVRNCGFSVELSNINPDVFRVYCEVNAFRLGWQKITFTVNFTDIISSIWNAARETVEALMQSLGGVFGRRKREFLFGSSRGIHTFLRMVRSTSNLTVIDIDFNEFNISGFEKDTDGNYENRVLTFRRKCIRSNVVFSFMKDAFIYMQDAVNESLQTIYDIENQKTELQKLKKEGLADNLTVENAGISREYATKDYNLTEEDLQSVLNTSKVAIAEDPLLNEITNALNDISGNFDEDLRVIDSVDFRENWLQSLSNVSLNYFKPSECSGFKDCILYSTSVLYDIFEGLDIRETNLIQQTILDVEYAFIELVQNETAPIREIARSVESILSYVRYLQEASPFCSVAPSFLSYQMDQNVLAGSSVTLACNVSGDPFPDIWWHKNGEIICDSNNVKLVILVAQLNDTGIYKCTAGNVVANISSPDIHLNVLEFDTDECHLSNGGCEHQCINTIGSYECRCKDGFRLKKDGHKCEDRDECKDNIDGCQHNCTNNVGAFTCFCLPGFELQSDDWSCLEPEPESTRISGPHTTSVSTVILAVSLSLLCLAITLGVVFVVHKKHRKSKVEPFSDSLTDLQKSKMNTVSGPVVDVKDIQGPKKTQFNRPVFLPEV